MSNLKTWCGLVPHHVYFFCFFFKINIMAEKKEKKHYFYLWIEQIENYVEITKETFEDCDLLNNIEIHGYKLKEINFKVCEVGNFINHYYELIKKE